MTMDLSGLQELKATGKKRAAKKAEAEWRPLDLATLHPGVVLACDQSVSALGLVLFEVIDAYSCVVHLAQQFTEPSYKGFPGLLRTVHRIQDRLEEYVAKWVTQDSWGPVIHAVHEQPPVNKGRMARPEVSLLSAYAFERATRHFHQLPFVGKQTHSKLICGEANADKKVHHAALATNHFGDIRGSELVTNGGTRDALSIALAAAHRGYS